MHHGWGWAFLEYRENWWKCKWWGKSMQRARSRTHKKSSSLRFGSNSTIKFSAATSFEKLAPTQTDVNHWELTTTEKDVRSLFSVRRKTYQSGAVFFFKVLSWNQKTKKSIDFLFKKKLKKVWLLAPQKKQKIITKSKKMLKTHSKNPALRASSKPKNYRLQKIPS